MKRLEKKPKRSVSWVFCRVASFLLGCGAVLLCAFALLIGYMAATAPELELKDVAPDGYRSTVLDASGEPILDLVGAESNRIYVTLDQIPRDVQDAFVAIEDERFYQHHGIDPKGIVRAAWRAVSSGSVTQGASTITQQLIKNNIFSDWVNEETLMDKVQRKLQEQFLAVKLETRVEKSWILENYLNTINLGAGTWGVQTAATRYFGKDVKDLTLSEAAVLAAIPKSPSAYNPLNHPEVNRERQLLVLDKMLELGSITQAEYDAAVADDVYARIQAESTPQPGQEVFSYFEDALIYQVVEDLQRQLGCAEDDAWRLLYHGGITICSTQDTALQTLCETEMKDESNFSSDAQASIVILDPYTGQVKAMVGGRGEKTASLTFNRAISSVRQPGSTMKVVAEYAAALDTGLVTLGQVYDDAPYTYSNGTPIKNASGTYAGKMTVRHAITRSINTVALQCFQQAGMDEIWPYLEAFGFDHLTEEDRVESLALGGTHGGVTNLELTAAYGAIASGGTYYEPSYYTQVLDREGRVIITRETEERSVLKKGTAALLTNALTGVLSDGTGQLASFSGMPLAGKSGTSDEMRDLWFVGYSPYYVCGVWGGYDDWSAQSSSAYVKRLWKTVMEQAHQGLDYREFDLSVELASCRICGKCGLLAVEGLCDSTVQGDVTYTETYISGTQPTESCTCHVAVTLCASSGQVAGAYCSRSGTTVEVYLAEGTVGTADEDAVLPENLANASCSVHSNWWDWIFPNWPGAGGFQNGGGTSLWPDSGQSSQQPWMPGQQQEEREEDFGWMDPSSWLDILNSL